MFVYLYNWPARDLIVFDFNMPNSFNLGYPILSALKLGRVYITTFETNFQRHRFKYCSDNIGNMKD